MKKIKSNINDIIYISRITQVAKKRLRIFFSVLLSTKKCDCDFLRDFETAIAGNKCPPVPPATKKITLFIFNNFQQYHNKTNYNCTG